MSQIVAIVGKPNVGKSTLFNRFVQKREAIVDPTSGVTRDRIYGKSNWNGREFSVIDTGGYLDEDDEYNFNQEIRKQVDLAIEEADVILFLVDVTTSITHDDEVIINKLRPHQAKVIIAVNKVDNHERLTESYEFYSLGWEQMCTISSISGSGTGELLDKIVTMLPSAPELVEERDIPRIAVVGRPNAGKSSFINQVVGKERFIVHNKAGTTRDTNAILFSKFGFEFELIDTAGIPKKKSVKENIDFYSVMRSVRAIEHCDVCIIMVDAMRGFERQDLNIFYLALRNLKGVVLFMNKWDLCQNKETQIQHLKKEIVEKTQPFKQYPIIFGSVLEKQRLIKVMEEATKVYHERKRKIKTHKLNEEMLPVFERTPPPMYKGKTIKIKYCTQLPSPTPKFVFFVNLPQYIKEPYKRFVENKLRELYSFEGVPLKLFFRKK